MDTDEALNTLKKAWFICEDTDTDDDEYWSEYNDQKLKKRKRLAMISDMILMATKESTAA